MSVRRTHYELAFESYLDRRGTPCVAIEDVKHIAKGRAGAKIFDYIVYPSGGPPCLVDVKGRKSSSGGAKGDCRQRTWVTRADLEGLAAWQEVFGEDYRTAFVFAYWLVGDPGPSVEAGPERAAEVWSFAGRRYSYWLVPAAEYAKHQRPLSKRWDTVSVPREVFRRISRRLETSWPAAPC